MNLSLIRQQVKTLNKTGLHLLIEDATSRINSHQLGGNPNINYIQKQEAIKDIANEELQKRSTIKEKSE